MKRRINKSLVSPLSAEITSTIREMGRGQRFVHVEIWARWMNIVGAETYKRTFPKSYRGTTLTVGVANSTWLQELSFLQISLLDKLAEAIGPGVVTEIRFVLDTAVGKHRPAIKTPSTDNDSSPATKKISKKIGMNDIVDPISKEDLLSTIRRASRISKKR